MIKDFNRFMYNQTQHRERKHFCMHCLKCFSSERVLADHREVCVSINGKQAITMPEPGSILKYENHRKQLDAPLIIYADFEAIAGKVLGCAQVGSKPYTDNTRNTPTVGTPMLVCCYDDKYSKPVEVFRGENAVNKFMVKMLEEVYIF